MKSESLLHSCFYEYVYGVLLQTPHIKIVSIGILLLLIISGILYGTLKAYASFSNDQIKQLKQSTDKTSIYILKQIIQPQLLRTHVLLASFCLHIVIAVCYFLFLIKNTNQTSFTFYALALILYLILITIFGKILPYIIAKKYPLGYAKYSRSILSISYFLFSPFYKIYNKIDIIKLRIRSKNNTITDNIAEALHVSTAIINDEKDIFEGIVKLKHTDLSSIMTPRVSIFAIEIATNFKDIIQEIINSGYSRVPVYSQTLDTIKGILYVKDLLPHLQKPGGFRWQTLIRPPYFIPESKKIDDLLEEFQKNKIHLAVVIDEYGGTCGIVTLEDILEEILGEINDEFDDDTDKNFVKLEENIYIFDGKTSINDVCKTLKINEDFFDAHKGDADSLAGLILEIKGDFPILHEEFEYLHLKFRIEDEDDRRILKIKITVNTTTK